VGRLYFCRYLWYVEHKQYYSSLSFLQNNLENEAG
jgi:hypothetical protein